MMNENEIIKNVKSVISQALKIDESKIGLDSSLIRDLGAESIDFLDIVFRLEKTFKIKIPKGELFPEKLLTDARFVKAGLVTAVAKLKRHPKLGRVVPEIRQEEYRELIYGNYRVVYRTLEKTISILTVRHYGRRFDPAELEEEI